MRAEDAIYGGEMSAHHYFRDFAYCDSGMIPWLLVAEMLSVKNIPLSEMVAQRISMFPSSGEINSTLDDPQSAINRVKEHFAVGAIDIHNIDGVSIEHTNWRFNLRCSNTEPVAMGSYQSHNKQSLENND